MPRLVEGAKILIKSHFIDLPLSATGHGSKYPNGNIDAIDGTIGSLDTMTISRENEEQYRVEVHNTTGWASGTRIPGTDKSLIQNRDRSESGPGGSLDQTFYWFIPVPKNKPR